MTYLHGSRKHFKEGFVLKPQRGGYVHQEENIDFERYLEARKPKGMISRFSSVFLTDDADLVDSAGGYNDAIYEVEPNGAVEASDLAWYSEAFLEFESKKYGGQYDQKILDQYCDNYWAGTQYIREENSNREFRVVSAKVVKMVELNVELEDLELVSNYSNEMLP